MKQTRVLEIMFRKRSIARSQKVSESLKAMAPHKTATSKATLNKLLYYIRESNWELVFERLDRKSSDIQERHLFLHEALQNKAPLSVIKALYFARPDAIYHQEPVQRRMALHVACANGLPIQVITFLCEKYSEATKHPSDGGRLPLHLVAISCADNQLPVLTYLLSIYPEAPNVQDSAGLTAIDYANNCEHWISEIFIREMERGYSFWSSQDIYSPKASAFARFLCEKEWDAASHCLLESPEEAILWYTYNNKRYLPIHLACMFHAPAEFVSELAEIHPFGLELTCQDENRTALHLACHYGSPYDVVMVLLKSHMDPITYQDDLGFLPLHLACQFASKSPSTKNSNTATIQALSRAYHIRFNMGDALNDSESNAEHQYLGLDANLSTA